MSETYRRHKMSKVARGKQSPRRRAAAKKGGMRSGRNNRR